ncbi:carbohydrate kinase family protein [Paenibacillaceae bacterium]|nr:carbohydrate kinase family protein [Paenibacillaceae bacterium]
MGALLIPGKLVDVGPAVVSTGGAVSNTGLALHRLGIRTKLMGKVGDDWFGSAIMDVLKQSGEELAGGMIVAPGGHSSYSIVISQPNVDRIFLHSTGANDTFAAADVRQEQLEGVKLFHFGYPPLMRKMYEQNGEQLTALLSSVKASGLTVSLDLAKPDPDSDAGRADWRLILGRTLPYVDVFLPSFEEILYMLRRDTYEALILEHSTNDLLPFADAELLSSLSSELLELGAAVVALKLGEHGLYVRTTADPQRLQAMGPCAPQPEAAAAWLDRELLAPCFKVQVAGTTGAGDCTIAGFLTGLLKGISLEEAIRSGVGVGACNVEQADATSGVPDWDKVQGRISAGWTQRNVMLELPGWTHDGSQGVWRKS